MGRSRQWRTSIALAEGNESAGDAVAVTHLREGDAIAGAGTARGRLHHLARLDKTGAISDYAILAPAE